MDHEIKTLYRSKLDQRSLRVRRPKDPTKTFVGGLVIGTIVGLLIGLIF